MKFFDKLIDDANILESTRNDIVLNKDKIYFDWMASGLESKIIQNRIKSILPYYANIHSNTSKHAKIMMELYLEAKLKIKQFLELKEDFIVIPSGYGATGAIKKYQEINGIYIPPKLKPYIKLNKTPVAIVGPYEHHSNEISLRESICDCIRIPLNGEVINLDYLDDILNKNYDRQIFASFNIASNVTGIIMPYKDVSNRLRKYKANIAFDLAAISPHKNIDSNLFDTCFLSPHKLLGGIGSCGILCINKKYFDLNLPPTFSGGGSIKYASQNHHYYIDDIERREDSGTPPILQLLKTALAYQYRNEVGLDFIDSRERILYEMIINELKTIDGISIYGINNNEKHIPVISFNIDSINSYDLTHELSYNYNIETRAGCSCAGPYGHDLLNKDEIKDIKHIKNKPSWVRISLHYSHNYLDIEYFITSLKKIINKLR